VTKDPLSPEKLDQRREIDLKELVVRLWQGKFTNYWP